jgi:hypothetical protein
VQLAGGKLVLYTRPIISDTPFQRADGFAALVIDVSCLAGIEWLVEARLHRDERNHRLGRRDASGKRHCLSIATKCDDLVALGQLRNHDRTLSAVPALSLRLHRHVKLERADGIEQRDDSSSGASGFLPERIPSFRSAILSNVLSHLELVLPKRRSAHVLLERVARGPVSERDGERASYLR